MIGWYDSAPDLENIDRYRSQRYLGENARVSKKAIWMPREISTKEWQIELVQLLERLAGFDPQTMQSEAAA